MKKVCFLVIVLLCLMMFTACGANASQSFEIEPCLKYIGIPIDGTSMNMSAEDAAIMNNAIIADVSGKIKYSVKSFGKAFNIAGTMTWKSEEDCSIEQFHKIKDSIISYYEVNTEEINIAELSEVKCRNDIYTIECKQDDSGYVIITWTYNIDQYDKNKVAGYAAINTLRGILKNPASLQVHSVGYAPDAYCVDDKNAIGIRVDYSAQNSFGGYNREYYYVWINPEAYLYTSVQTFLNPEYSLDDAYFISFSVDNKNTLHIPYTHECNTVLVSLDEQSYPVAESLMDNTLIAYLQYLSMTYDECGFNAGQASDAEGKRYELKDAEFLGEICEVDLLFDSTESNAMPVGLDIGRPASSYSAKEMYLKICKGLGVDATDDGDMLFLISIPDTDFEIKIFQVSSVVPSDILIRLADE